LIDGWKTRARELKREVHALVLASRDPRVPWYAKALLIAVVAYAFSPIDLVPDFIPVLGYLDDLLLIPLGIMAARALVPADVLAECRARARELENEPRNWAAAAVIIGVWIALGAATVWWLVQARAPSPN
jgi:uncharacterized membrane protein YkvA (DUF1232 family)